MPERIDDKKLLKSILWEDDDELYTLIKTYQTDKGRWHDHMDTVFKRNGDNKLFIMHWSRAATEQQEHEYADVAYEAEQYTETVTRYRALPREKNTYSNMPKNLPKCSMENWDDD